MADLVAFMRRASARPFVVGEHDCGIWLADWVKECRGVDPAASLRGRYGPSPLATGWGGLPRVFMRLARAAGLRNTKAPRPADIAIVALPHSTPVGAIRVAAGWMFLAAGGGLSRAPVGGVRVIAAWKV